MHRRSNQPSSHDPHQTHKQQRRFNIHAHAHTYAKVCIGTHMHTHTHTHIPHLVSKARKGAGNFSGIVGRKFLRTIFLRIFATGTRPSSDQGGLPVRTSYNTKPATWRKEKEWDKKRGDIGGGFHRKSVLEARGEKERIFFRKYNNQHTHIHMNWLMVIATSQVYSAKSQLKNTTVHITTRSMRCIPVA
jgi:hypothetical protein